MKTRAYSYLRVSGQGQVIGDGFPRQRTAIKAYALANDIKIVREFREEGVNGSIETMNRAAWAELLALLHADGVRMILIEKLDRLARDLMVQETAIAYLQNHGFALVSVAEPDLMVTDPARVAMRQMLGVFAQYDKSTIVIRLRGSRINKKAKTGRCEGRKPYGYREGEAAIIERMAGLRRSGMGFDRIAVQLNADGIKPRSGKAWYGITVNKILARVSA